MRGTVRDFSQLYRSALAERDPERKHALLHQVQQHIDDWAQASLPSDRNVTVVGMDPSDSANSMTPSRGNHEESMPIVA